MNILYNEVIKEKIKKIKIELIHEGYNDGWYIQYLNEKKTKLENELIYDKSSSK